MTSEEVDAIRDRHKKAMRYVAELCNGQRRWEMSIPIQDDDVDIVLADALDDIPRLLELMKETT